MTEPTATPLSDLAFARARRVGDAIETMLVSDLGKPDPSIPSILALGMSALADELRRSPESAGGLVGSVREYLRLGAEAVAFVDDGIVGSTLGPLLGK